MLENAIETKEKANEKEKKPRNLEKEKVMRMRSTYQERPQTGKKSLMNKREKPEFWPPYFMSYFIFNNSSILLLPLLLIVFSFYSFIVNASVYIIKNELYKFLKLSKISLIAKYINTSLIQPYYKRCIKGNRRQSISWIVIVITLADLCYQDGQHCNKQQYYQEV